MLELLLLYIFLLPDCLLAYDDNNETLRIMNGFPCSTYVGSNLDYVVSLAQKHNERHFCGGIVFKPTYVLTAAHCLQPPNPDNFAVLLFKNTSKHMMVEIKKQFIHPKYKKRTGFNIAVLQLSKPVPNSLRLATLVGKRIRVPIHWYCRLVLLAGWGNTDFEGNQGVKPKAKMCVTLPVIKAKRCWFRYRVKNIVCTYPIEGKSGLSEDGGSPLICQKTGLVIGVFFGFKFKENMIYPSMSTRVDISLRFIHGVTISTRSAVEALTPMSYLIAVMLILQ